MKFRPCIDIHNGAVKQIVGGSLQDEGSRAEDNFVSIHDAAWFASKYRKDGLRGGHIILLNPKDSPWYEKDLEQAEHALKEYPGGLQIGGGVTPENAERFLEMGASHVIVTSYVFCGGIIDYDRLSSLSSLIGSSRLVLDLSCRRYGDEYYIVTDRWQNRTKERLMPETMEHLAEYCDEFLIHAVDVEGKSAGMDESVLSILAAYQGKPVTYAGGIHSMEDISLLKTKGAGRIDFTIGSSLDLFGGTIPYEEIKSYFHCTRTDLLKL